MFTINIFLLLNYDHLDGRRFDTSRAVNGIYSNTSDRDIRCSIRNPDHCSAFRTELILNSIALIALSVKPRTVISILTNSRSSIQYLNNCPKLGIWQVRILFLNYNNHRMGCVTTWTSNGFRSMMGCMVTCTPNGEWSVKKKLLFPCLQFHRFVPFRNPFPLQNL